jgi:hypothetical protein
VGASVGVFLHWASVDHCACLVAAMCSISHKQAVGRSADILASFIGAQAGTACSGQRGFQSLCGSILCGSILASGTLCVQSRPFDPCTGQSSLSWQFLPHNIQHTQSLLAIRVSLALFACSTSSSTVPCPHEGFSHHTQCATQVLYGFSVESLSVAGLSQAKGSALPSIWITSRALLQIV